MFAKSRISAKLDAEITSALDKLETLEKHTEEYGALIDRITKLHKLKSEDDMTELKLYESQSKITSDSKLKPPSMDTVLVVGANLLGILWITRFERGGVITTRAFGNILKPR